MPGQWRRHADDDDLHLAEPVEIAGGGKPSGIALADELGIADCLDIGGPGRHRFDLGGIDVETQHGKPLRATVMASGRPT